MASVSTWERIERQKLRRRERRIRRYRPGDRPDSSRPAGTDMLPQIKHIVVLMMENHSYDNYFGLLMIAGNETTRHTISHGMKALTDHPAQREAWWADYDGVTRTAVEEIVRWASPVIHFRRTALADTEIAGVPIKEGQKVEIGTQLAEWDPFAVPLLTEVGGVVEVRPQVPTPPAGARDPGCRARCHGCPCGPRCSCA